MTPILLKYSTVVVFTPEKVDLSPWSQFSVRYSLCSHGHSHCATVYVWTVIHSLCSSQTTHSYFLSLICFPASLDFCARENCDVVECSVPPFTPEVSLLSALSVRSHSCTWTLKLNHCIFYAAIYTYIYRCLCIYIFIYICLVKYESVRQLRCNSSPFFSVLIIRPDKHV